MQKKTGFTAGFLLQLRPELLLFITVMVNLKGNTSTYN